MPTVSLAWAAYGLLLLGIGMARGSQGLRWVSLAFLMCTIGKVFLYDLGHLRDLYRELIVRSRRSLDGDLVVTNFNIYDVQNDITSSLAPGTYGRGWAYSMPPPWLWGRPH